MLRSAVCMNYFVSGLTVADRCNCPAPSKCSLGLGLRVRSSGPFHFTIKTLCCNFCRVPLMQVAREEILLHLSHEEAELKEATRTLNFVAVKVCRDSQGAVARLLMSLCDSLATNRWAGFKGGVCGLARLLSNFVRFMSTGTVSCLDTLCDSEGLRGQSNH